MRSESIIDLILISPLLSIISRFRILCKDYWVRFQFTWQSFVREFNAAKTLCCPLLQFRSKQKPKRDACNHSSLHLSANLNDKQINRNLIKLPKNLSHSLGPRNELLIWFVATIGCVMTANALGKQNIARRHFWKWNSESKFRGLRPAFQFSGSVALSRN